MNAPAQFIKCGCSVDATSHMNPVPIPESHRDLLDGTYCAALTTVMPDGQPQITPVWYSREGDYILLNTMRGFRKEKNMRANPKVTLLAYNTKHPLRYIEIRGIVVEMREEGDWTISITSPNGTWARQVRGSSVTASLPTCRRATSRSRSRWLPPIFEWKNRAAWPFPFPKPIAISWSS